MRGRRGGEKAVEGEYPEDEGVGDQVSPFGSIYYNLLGPGLVLQC